MKTRITELFGIQHPIIQGGRIMAQAEQILTERIAGMLRG